MWFLSHFHYEYFFCFKEDFEDSKETYEPWNFLLNYVNCDTTV